LIETTRIFRQSAIARGWLGNTFVERIATTRVHGSGGSSWTVTDWELMRYFEII
jgi:glutamine synthetase